MSRSGRQRISITEALGLIPFSRDLRGIGLVLGGDRNVPAARVGASGLRLLRPRLALSLWRGKTPCPRQAVITALFNRRQTPAALGWSTRRTQIRDYRGRTLTYDSHNGTDFAVPPGSVITAAAPGHVALTLFEFNRGGLKLLVDHGGGWFTSYNHLSRTLRAPGTPVARGEAIALSGASGLDGVLFFPWLAPHLHFNVLAGATMTDPFAAPGEISLWRPHNTPASSAAGVEPIPERSVFIENRVKAAIAGCASPRRRSELARLPAEVRGAAVLVDLATYPTRYPGVDPALVEIGPRRPFLCLPLSAEAFDGAVYADQAQGGES
jgi:murein DD-endopeptidase